MPHLKVTKATTMILTKSIGNHMKNLANRKRLRRRISHLILKKGMTLISKKRSTGKHIKNLMSPRELIVRLTE